MKRKDFGVTLIELVIAVTLMSLLVLSYFQIDSFSRFQVVSSNRKARLQSEVSLCLEQLAKDAVGAIGDFNHATVLMPASGDIAIKIWVDGNSNGRRDAYPSDHKVAYRFTGSTGGPSDHQVWYYPNCVGVGDDCDAGSVGPEVLAKHIYSFTPSMVNNNIDIIIEARWDPTILVSIDNPAVNMQARLNMPAVSNR